jgi:leucyl aminopeptidase
MTYTNTATNYVPNALNCDGKFLLQNRFSTSIEKNPIWIIGVQSSKKLPKDFPEPWLSTLLQAWDQGKFLGESGQIWQGWIENKYIVCLGVGMLEDSKEKQKEAGLYPAGFGTSSKNPYITLAQRIFSAVQTCSNYKPIPHESWKKDHKDIAGIDEQQQKNTIGIWFDVLEDDLLILMGHHVITKSWIFQKYLRNQDVFKDLFEGILEWKVKNEFYCHHKATSYDKLTHAIGWARGLIAEPANVLNPTSFIQEILERNKVRNLNLEIKIIDEAALKVIEAGALLGVGQGSAIPPALLIMKWPGSPEYQETKPLVVIGKGVTFDTGGISIKPADNMDAMKGDMAGAAVVAGTCIWAAESNYKYPVIGILPLAENAIGKNAQRPGDIVKSLSGKTIEVLNTDAEGRLILADALTYAQHYLNIQPALMIDFATLTGAMSVALSRRFAGIFSNTPEIVRQLIEAGRRSGEELWSMPIDEDFENAMKGDELADLKNIAPAGFGGGSSTGAQFLYAFIENNIPWAHIDIANMTFDKKKTGLGRPEHVPYGMRLMAEFLMNFWPQEPFKMNALN